jgi:uncharacterized delta-60 repeat protein
MPRSILVLLFAFAALLCGANGAAAAPGDIDTAFGANGLVSSGFPGVQQQFGGGIGVQSSGKIVLAAAVYYGASKSVIVKRFNTDGSPDESFGTLGSTAIDFDNSATDNDVVRSLHIVSGDKILIAGSVSIGGNEDAAVARLTPDGLPDSTFQPTGRRIPTPFNYPAADAIEDSSGRTLVLGSDSTKFIVYRLLPNGDNDSSFNITYGWVQYYDPNALDVANAIMIANQSDGKTIISGHAHDASNKSAMTSIRLIGSAYDPSYSGDGIAQAAPGPVEDAATMQPDNRVVVAGIQIIGLTAKSFAQRFNTDGTVDSSFGSNGLLSISSATTDLVYALTSDSLGRIYALVSSSNGSGGFLQLFRYTADGAVDTSFGINGARPLPVPFGSTAAGKVIVDANDNALATAYDENSGSSAATFITRILGNPDPVPPPTSPATFTLKLTNPKSNKVKKLTRISGSAVSNRALQKVEIGVERIDKKALTKHKRCIWIKNAKGALKNVKARAKKCGSPVWLTTSGTTSWSYKLKKPLKKGSYLLTVRATTADAVVSPPVTRSFKLTG